MKIFWGLVIAHLKELIRNKMELTTSFGFAVLIVLVFGYLYSGSDMTEYKIGIVEMETNQASKSILEAFDNIPSLKIETGSEEEELDALEKGNVSMVVVLPEGLQEAISKSEKITVPVYYNENNSNLLYLINDVFVSAEFKLANVEQLIQIQPQKEYVEEHKQIDFILPIMMSIMFMQLGLYGSTRMVNLKESKMLKSLGTTPLPKGIFIASEVFVRMMESVVQAIAMIVVAYLVFDLHITGNWMAVLGLVLLGAGTFVSLGYVLATFAKTVDSMTSMVNLFVFPFMVLSGLFIPIENFPNVIKPIVKLIPITYLSDSLSTVMSGTQSAYGLMVDVIALCLFLIINLILASKFKWE